MFDAFDGQIIISGTPNLVDAFCRAAQQNAKLRNTLLNFVHASAYGDITMAACMMLVPILIHHNVINPAWFGFQATEEPTTNGVEDPQNAYTQN